MTFRDGYDKCIAEDGVAVIHMGYPTCHLYTIGNTAHRCPELLAFCSDARLADYIDLLIDLSAEMQTTDDIPEPQRFRRVRGKTFGFLAVDGVYIAQFAPNLLSYYNHAPMIQALQVLTPDHHHRYPYDSTYDHRFLHQPICRTH